MKDQELKCINCPATFVFTAVDQAFYTERGFKEPKRCSACRIIKKAKFNDQPIQKEQAPIIEQEQEATRQPWQDQLQDFGKKHRVKYREDEDF